MNFDWFELGKIISSADGGCGNCVCNLVEQIKDMTAFDKEKFVQGLKVDDYYWAKDIESWFEEDEDN